MRFALTLALAAAVFVTAVQVILSQHQSRRVFVDIQRLEVSRDRLNEEWGRLQLEQSTWATADRIERLATTRLQMVEPDSDSTVLLRR